MSGHNADVQNIPFGLAECSGKIADVGLSPGNNGEARPAIKTAGRLI
jgi:hypothetical protein